MSCDLVGSNARSGQPDPEDLQTVLSAFHSTCAGVIAGFGGTVTRFSGGGAFAYFGLPQAHEHDAEQAVRAGLGVVSAVARITAGITPPLHVCVGIATGLVLVGDLGDHHSLKGAVVGETPNLAFRLQGIADPDAVLIAASTRDLVGGLFECRELGCVSSKGSDDPVKVYQVLEERGIESRFEALHETRLTPLVGREHEIALLLERWELSKGGEGQVMLLAGEPGIGKSRIAEALRERLLADGPHLLLRYQCSPQRTASALYPVVTRLEHAAGFRREDDSGARLAKLEDLLRREVNDAITVAPLFGALLAIPTDGRYPPLGLTPPQQKAKTLEALAGQLEAMAARLPVLLIFEDLQWADPTSLELLGIVVDRAQRLRVLAVLTFRPEFSPPWTGHAHLTLLSLNRLGRRDAAALAERVGGGKPLPAEVLDQILARTDGVPLFIEELTRAVLESGLLKEAADRYVLGGPLPPLAIPTTLHDSLMTRLDRLAPVKEVAQLAACIGREFSHDMLAAVSPLGADALGIALGQLVTSELIHRGGLPSAVSYTFRHALVQEAAYHSLLSSRRQQLHAGIAQIVEQRFPEIAARQPEWLAHHYAEAGLAERASDYWLEAGRRAKAAYALREAATHLEKCLDAALTSPPGGGDSPASIQGSRRLEALVMLGDVASLTGDLDGANRRYEQALDLASDAGTKIRIENKRHRSGAAFREGAKIAFYEHGGGHDTLLFVSPLAYGLAAIQPVLEQLCQEFRIVTVDPRGSGASDLLKRPYGVDEHAKDIRTVIAALGDRPVIGVGISAGANMLLRLAQAEQWLFSKLVTVGAPPSDVSRAFRPSYPDRRPTALEKQDVARLVRSHTELVFSEPEMRELREQTISSRLLLPRETILSFFDLDPGKNVMPLLADIPMPVLVTHGREDRVIAFTAAEEIASGLPNAQLYGFEGKGHLPIFTATDEFCEVLRRFVRTGTASARDRP